MADRELAADFVADVADIERALLLGHTGVEHDLQHQVAQFLAEKDVVVVVDGLDDLIGLLDEIFADRPVRLLTVPGGSPRARGAASLWCRGRRSHSVFWSEMRLLLCS